MQVWRIDMPEEGFRFLIAYEFEKGDAGSVLDVAIAAWKV
jgi:hypothetical protein